MPQLVASSNPSEINRYDAIATLAQRAVLTRSVCSELLTRNQGQLCRWRADAALSNLMNWVLKCSGDDSDPVPSFGIESMAVPNDCIELLNEIRDGARACDALYSLQTADTDSEFDHDMVEIEKALATYWGKYSTATCPPPLHPELLVWAGEAITSPRS